MQNKNSESSEITNKIPRTIEIILKGICNNEKKRIGQLCSDLEALPLKLAQFLKKFLIASVNIIIFFGLSEPEVKVSFRKSREKLFFLIGTNLLEGQN